MRISWTWNLDKFGKARNMTHQRNINADCKWGAAPKKSRVPRVTEPRRTRKCKCVCNAQTRNAFLARAVIDACFQKHAIPTTSRLASVMITLRKEGFVGSLCHPLLALVPLCFANGWSSTFFFIVFFGGHKAKHLWSTKLLQQLCGHLLCQRVSQLLPRANPT